MSTEGPRVGEDILYYCVNCKLTLSHMITVVFEKNIIKVRCNTCKKERMHKEKKEKEKQKNLGQAVVRMCKKTKKENKENKADSIDWGKFLHMPQRSYSISRTFSKNDLIVHKKFGLGVVLLSDKDTIQVGFRDLGTKTLVHNRI